MRTMFFFLIMAVAGFISSTVLPSKAKSVFTREHGKSGLGELRLPACRRVLC